MIKNLNMTSPNNLNTPNKKPPLPFGLASIRRSSSTVNKSILNDLLNPSHHYHSSNRKSSSTLNQLDIPDASMPYYLAASAIHKTPSSSSMLYGTMSSTTSIGSCGRKLSESFRLKSTQSPVLLPTKESLKNSQGVGCTSATAGSGGGSSSQISNDSEFSNLKLKSRLNRQLSVNAALLRSSFLNTYNQNNTNNSSSSTNASNINNSAAIVAGSGAMNAPGTQSLPRKKKKFASTLSSSASFLQRKRHSIESLIGFCKK